MTEPVLDPRNYLPVRPPPRRLFPLPLLFDAVNLLVQPSPFAMPGIPPHSTFSCPLLNEVRKPPFFFSLFFSLSLVFLLSLGGPSATSDVKCPFDTGARFGILPS